MSTTEGAPEEVLVRDALHHATDTDELAAPVQRLTAAATCGGRRLRRRRRIFVSASAVCAAAAMAVPIALSLGPNPARDADVANDPTVSLPDPLPVSDQPGWWDMPATEMLDRLKDTTPDGLGYADPVLTNEGENAPGEPVGEMRGYLTADVVENGTTVGGVNVMLYAPNATYRDQWTCPGNLEPDLLTACSEIKDDSGAIVGRRSESRSGDVVDRVVTLRQADGGLVFVAASNSASDKWRRGSAVSDEPPFSMAQLLDIASDRLWTTYEPS